MEHEEGASPVVDLWALRLARTSEAAPLAGVKAGAVFQSWLAQTEERSRARDGRLLEARHPLPPLLWVLIAIASALLIGFVLFYADPSERARAQAMMAGSVTAVIVASALLVIFLNAPYGDGGGTIKPSAMSHALALMQTEYTGRPPCRANGAPA
jgi:hypothetical protein